MQSEAFLQLSNHDYWRKKDPALCMIFLFCTMFYSGITLCNNRCPIKMKHRSISLKKRMGWPSIPVGPPPQASKKRETRCERVSL